MNLDIIKWLNPCDSECQQWEFSYLLLRLFQIRNTAPWLYLQKEVVLALGEEGGGGGGVCAWPINIRMNSTIDKFKKDLKTHLFISAFNV